MGALSHLEFAAFVMRASHKKPPDPYATSPLPASGIELHPPAMDEIEEPARAARVGRADTVGRVGRTEGAGRANSFAGHYGQLILSDGVAPIPRALYLYQRALNLSPQQVWFISYVLSHKWDEGLPHPRLQEMARHATLGLRQIKNIKSSIVQAGLLRIIPRYGTGGEQDQIMETVSR